MTAIGQTNRTSQNGVPYHKSSNMFSRELPRIIKNINLVALPAIAVFALSILPGADGGPLSYSACCIACTALLPPAIPACLSMCLGFLFLPSP
ncbi:MAG: hypothetical protein P4L16_06870 [Chlamydiales bacterium]|nr:hypothetical protein [Chlamydiales bacterium]